MKWIHKNYSVNLRRQKKIKNRFMYKIKDKMIVGKHQKFSDQRKRPNSTLSCLQEMNFI